MTTMTNLNTELKAKAAAAGLSTYVANAILSNDVTEAMLDNAAIAFLERWYWDAHEAIVQSEERVVAAQKAIDAYLASGASLF
jgi:hypothetical protein